MKVKTSLQSMRVYSTAQIQCLRIIRNSGAQGYSHHNEQITEDEQWKWWLQNKDRMHAWLYIYRGTVIGYGLIRRTGQGIWNPSAGVLPEHWGQGFGGAIVDDLVCQARELGVKLEAQAKLDNPAAVATHHNQFWTKTGEDKDFVYFESKE